MRRLLFPAYCLLLSVLAMAAAEFWLLPRLLQLPRATLLSGFVATPGSIIDGQRINRMGYTGDVIDADKTPGTLRVLLLGSSTLFNRHLGEHMKTALQQQTGQHIELVDAGIRSHTSRADVIKLQQLAALQFDYVIFYDSINDLWANHIAPQYFDRDYAHLDAWYRRNTLLEHSLLARYSYNLARQGLQWLAMQTGYNAARYHPVVFVAKPWMNAAGFAATANYAHNVQSIIDLARQSGATPVVLTFASHLPSDYTREKFLADQLDYINPDHYDRRDVYNWGTPAYVREGLQQHNQVIKTLAARNDVMLIDIDAAMSGHGEWFGDVCHFNDAGVQQFTTRVSNALRDKISQQSH